MLTFNRKAGSTFRVSGERVGWVDHWADRSLNKGRATAGFSREGEKSASFLSAVEGWMAWTMVVSPVAVFLSPQF